MTIFLNIDALPAPSDIELETMDRQAWARRSHSEEPMTLPDFCTICLHIDGRARQQFVNFVDVGCNRIEAGGETIEYPLRKTRQDWYADWNAFEAQDKRQTEMGARYVGVPR